MTTENSRADALTEAVTRTIETIKRQLDLIADRAPGNYLDKRPVVQSLGAHVRRLEKALAEAESLQPAAAPLDKPSVNDTITFSGDSLTLSGAQLLEALDFIAPDRDADQLESEVTIQYGEGHTGNGMYCWCTEYPEEGAIFIDGSTAVPAAPAPAPSPADERAAFEKLAAKIHYPGCWDTAAYPTLAEALVECAAWYGMRCGECDDGSLARATSANETGAPIGWAWISPTGHVSRFTAYFDGKHDQLVQGWKVRPVAFCDSVANETGTEGVDTLAHEVWSAAQRAPGEGIEDGVQRIAAILSRAPAQADARVGLTDEQRKNANTALNYLNGCGGFEPEVKLLRALLQGANHA
ncbi:hypothetical protein [Burkholderia vietnamiensis]|uniref:hypothetical protein n=1 Tax=Burkholderia vietnamiensis TaxID=60552 RepID=UPI000AEAAADB|nr:hypothetical protein [Burkholderia vietnamiensis]